MAFDFDIFVIGGGSGGVRAGRLAAAAGKRVGLAEEYRMGGTCVIRGCVPKKLMVYASQYSEAFEDAEGYGWSPVESSFDWGRFIAAKDAEIDRLEGIYSKNLAAAGATEFKARARVTGAQEVTLSTGETFSAETILIAVGGRPFVPEIPGAEHAITSNEIFHLEAQPKRIAIIGGGYIASEFAGIMNGLGSAVTQIYRGDQILRGFDDEMRHFVAGEMEKKGINVMLGASPIGIEKTADGLVLSLDKGDAITVDQVLFATGRVPNTGDLGLEAVGVETGKKGEIIVDGYSQTSVPSIYAVGDVTDRVQLTPVAIREGVAFVETVIHGNPSQPDHELIPTAIFTQPEIGTVGLSEEDARAAYDIEVYKTAFRPMNHIIAGKEERMMMKLIVEKGSEKVLGVHIVGHAAGEMIQMVGIAVKMGATKADFDRTVAVHPTAAEELVTLK